MNDEPNVQIIAAINDLITNIQAGEDHEVLEQLALAIKALVEASGG